MKPSPRIEHLEWGAMSVAGVGRGRDMKLWPGGGREWDWRETGTHHRVAETNDAAVLYNRLADLGEPVGGLFHSTC